MSNKAELSGSEDDFEMDQDNIDEGASPELLEAVATLKSALHDNPNQYEQHTQLITLLKSADMLEELRAAREAMNAVFPLSEDLWLEWIEDESNMAASEEEKKHILELYRRATSEYLSIKIWKSYVDYATQEFVESVDLPESEIVVSKDDMRRIFKDADKYTGHHIPESHTIWNCWRDFELQLIAAQTPASPEDVKRVKTMYLERIAIPHADQENTFSSLSSFISQHDNADYENTMVQSNKIMSNTRKLLSERERFEQDLVSTSNGLEAFMSYLEFESNPARRLFARLRTLFERAVSVHCLVPAVWNDYASFLMSSNPRNKQYDLNPSEVLSIAGKAVRNCPWSGDLWENRFLLMEIHMRSEDEVNAVFASGLSNPVLLGSPQELSKMLVARCSHKFRVSSKDEDGHNKIREAFKHALTVMDAAGGDPYCRLERFWIELEANVLGDHEKARKLWIDIESKQKTLSDYWITQADMERRLQNLKDARQIFVRACNVAKHLDWPEKIFETWLMFERQNGSVTDYKEAVVRSRNAMKAVETLRAQAALQAESIYSEQMAYSSTSTAAAATEPAQAPPSSSMEAMPETTNKRRLSAQDDQQASKAAKTGDSAADQTSQRIRNQKRPLDISTGRHEDTCFVTNFPDTMTEAKLRELFAEFGTILRCTIPQRPGTKRNFGYVQFSSSEEAHAALALDGRDVGEQRGLCVNISDTGKAKRTKGGKAPLPKVSRHELHVSGFTNEMKEDELQKLVELHATPVEVFIKRQARSKGPAWANIKFETEEEANAALALDGTMFHGKPLNVKRREFQNSHWEKDEQHSGSSKGHRGNQAADAKEKGGKSQRSQQHKDRQERAKSDGQEQVGTDAETTGGGLAVGSTSAAEESSTQIKGSNDGTLDSAATDNVNEDKKAQGSFASETQDRATTAAPRKPMAKLTSMQPRVLQPRQAPKRAFKQVSLRTANPVGSSASTTSTSGEGSGEGPSTAAPAAPAAAPKSNAEFRALMLSGALKKKQT